MNKPKRKTRSYLDYHECRNFLQNKYGYEERDFSGKNKFEREIENRKSKEYGEDPKVWRNIQFTKFTPNQSKMYEEIKELQRNSPPYQDFWHWLVKVHEIHNGCTIVFSQEEYDDFKDDTSTPEFVKTIYNYYLKEFADENCEVEMEVSW